MGLTLEEANRILRGALAKAQELNINISAAICDPGGRPIALQRMDNTMWASAYAAQGKAVVSAAFGRPSGEMAERADMPALRGLTAAKGGHMIMAQGAVPIIRNGVVEGACGVSGGHQPTGRKTAPAPASRNCSGSSRRPTARSSAVCSTRPAHGDISRTVMICSAILFTKTLSICYAGPAVTWSSNPACFCR
jgi:glc operon protein GlcG